MYARYRINFSTENIPTETIIYKTGEEILATAVYPLDGYDAEKKIGYKLITQDDKVQWEQAIKDDNIETSDLQYYEQIQTAIMITLPDNTN